MEEQKTTETVPAATEEQKGFVDDAIGMVEGASLEALESVLTPENVAMVETLAEGFILAAVQEAISTNVPLPFVASLLKKLVSTERVHAILKTAERQIVEFAREQAAKTTTTFDDKVVEVVADAVGVAAG